MNCRNHCCALDENFDRRVAARELRRYRREGASPSTRQLISAIREAGIDGATVLDIGGGIGTIAGELLDAGAARATLVESSSAYLAAAREEAERRGQVARLQFIHGDFVAIAAQVSSADVITLDKVVCCYPDMEQILAASTGRARRLFGIVYPRDGWWLRLATAAQNAVSRLGRSAFRVYVFPNAAIEDAIQRAGWSLLCSHRGLIWVVALYERPGS